MKEIIIAHLILLAFFLTYIRTQITVENQRKSSEPAKLFCFYNNSNDFQLTAALLNKINSLCSHFMYFTTTIHPQKGLVITNTSTFTTIKEFNRNAKLLIQIYPPFDQNDLKLILNRNVSKSLTRLIVKQLRAYNLDGIALHSDFACNATNQDRPIAITKDSVEDFRTAIDEEAAVSRKPKLTLMMSTPRISSFIYAYINVSSLVEKLDLLFVSNDNYFDPEDHLLAIRNLTGSKLEPRHRRLLYTDETFINYFLRQGVQPKKLIFSLFSYGYTFTLSEPYTIKLDTPLYQALPTVPFSVICDAVINGVGWSDEHINSSASGAYSYRGDQWFSYQDDSTVRAKTKFAMNKHLGGVAISLHDDDFSGKCYKPLSLTEAAKEAIVEYENELLRAKFPGSTSNAYSCPRPEKEHMKIKCFIKKKNIPCDDTLYNGTIVTFTCKSHFQMEDSKKYPYIECRNGQWIGQLSKCVPSCGKITYNGSIQLLISKGQKEPINESPWHVAIYNAQKILICGGTLIHQQIVVSAAHCFYNDTLQIKKNASDYEIIVSKQTRNYTQQDNIHQRSYKIKEIRFSAGRGYSGFSLNYAEDIALLILDKKIQPGPTVFPACIDLTLSEFTPTSGTSGKVVGWGLAEEDRPSESLLKANLRYIGYDSCIKTDRESAKFVTLDKFCAGNETGAGVRQGDSGGGLLFQNPSNGLYYLRGIVSVRPVKKNSSMGFFTDINYHSGWIKNDIKKIDAGNSQ